MTTLELLPLLAFALTAAVWSTIFTNSVWINMIKAAWLGIEVEDMSAPLSPRTWAAYMLYCTKCHSTQLAFLTSLLVLGVGVGMSILLAATTSFLAQEFELLLMRYNYNKEVQRREAEKAAREKLEPKIQ